MNKLAKLFPIVFVLFLLFLVACAPAGGDEPQADLQTGPALVAQDDAPALAEQPAEESAAQTADQLQAAGVEDLVTFHDGGQTGGAASPPVGEFEVETSTAAEPSGDGVTEIQNQGEGATTEIAREAAAGSSPATGASSSPSGRTSGGQTGLVPGEVDMTTWTLYNNDTYRFSVAYPDGLRLREADGAGLDPAPVSVYRFDRAEGADLPTFTVRIFRRPLEQSLETWLESVGLVNRAAGWQIAPYQGGSFTGLSAQSPNFIAPGWFVYVEANGLVYQLTPLGEVGEGMLTSFRIW